MVIIELCGLPGCGKSTLAEKIVDYLKKNTRCNIYDRSQVVSIDFISRVLKKLRLPIPIYLFSPYKKVIDEYLKDKEQQPFYYKSRLVFLARNLARLSRKNNDSIVVLDEGIIESIASLSHGHVMQDDDRLEALTNTFTHNTKHIQIVYAKISPEEALTRIHNRQKKGDRYMCDNDEHSYELMRIKDTNIKLILRHYRGTLCELDMSKSPDSVFDDFVGWITKSNIL